MAHENVSVNGTVQHSVFVGLPAGSCGSVLVAPTTPGRVPSSGYTLLDNMYYDIAYTGTMGEAATVVFTVYPTLGRPRQTEGLPLG